MKLQTMPIGDKVPYYRESRSRESAGNCCG